MVLGTYPDMADAGDTPTLSGTHEPKTDEPAPLEFFNYHEYLVDSDAGQLVVTHFPNAYVAANNSNTTSTTITRVVRVPRVYHDNVDSDVVPQFSTVVPGAELYAISDGSHQFNPIASVEGVVFGKTLWTPLVPDNITPKQFEDIVTTVNSHLQAAFRPLARSTMENVLDVLLAGVWSSVWGNSVCKQELAKLDAYIDSINASLAPVHLISPRRSGFLSLDFCIPSPHLRDTTSVVDG